MWFTTSNCWAAAKKAKRLSNALRPQVPGGKWTELKVDLPGGGDSTLYASPDKSPQQLQTERHCKMLRNIIADKVGQKYVTMLRKQGGVQFHWKPIAKVVAVERGFSEVSWNADALATIGTDIDREAIVEEFRQKCTFRPLDKVRWT